MIPQVALSCLVFALLASGVCAQADQMLRDAYDRLLAARSYEWLETQLIDSNARARRQTRGRGTTMIDAHTVATIAGIEAVFLGEDAVFELKSGWRHIRDLTDADVFELQGRRSPYFVNAREGPDGFRRYVYLSVHDLFWWLLTNATGLRVDGSTIVGNLPHEAESSIRVGRLPASATTLSSVLRGLRPRPTRTPGNRTATFTVWLSGGNITKFSCEFAFSARVKHEYTYELNSVGTARINVPAEAKTLLAAK